MRKYILLALVLVGIFAMGAVSCSKSYKSKKTGFRFEYAPKLNLQEEGNAVYLFHAIPWKHSEPCDFGGEEKMPPRETLLDISTSLEIVEGPLKRVIQEILSDSSIEFNGDLPKERGPGWFGDYRVGSLQGYWVQKGVEGCGLHKYLFPLAGNKVLVVSRGIVTELSSIYGRRDEALALPGVIPPEEEEKLFEQVLTSFRVIP